MLFGSTYTRIVKFVETESTLVDAGWGEMGRECLMGTEFQFWKMENSGHA